MQGRSEQVPKVVGGNSSHSDFFWRRFHCPSGFIHPKNEGVGWLSFTGFSKSEQCFLAIGIIGT